MSAVDSLWLHMDTPANPMTIEGVMWFEGHVDWDRATRVVSRRLADRYPVFTQRPVLGASPLGGDMWEPDPEFRVEDHVHRVTLPEPGGDEELQAFIEARMAEPFDRSKALWHCYFVDNYHGSSALVSRFHHSMADGIALARVLLDLTDDRPEADLEPVAEPDGPLPHSSRTASAFGGAVRGLGGTVGRGVEGVSPGALQDVVHSAAHGVTDRAGVAAELAGSQVSSAVRGGLHMASRVPLLDPRGLRDALEFAAASSGVAAKLLMADSGDNIYSGQTGGLKRAVWSEAVDVAAIKRAARSQDATINDLMIAALAGALRRHSISVGADPRDLVTMVPVNLRPLDQPLPRTLGNKFALVMLDLPIGGASPAKRLRIAKARMDAIKSSPEAVLTFGIIGTSGALHPQVARFIVDFFSHKGIGVTTNVPGPREERYFAGREVKGVLGWAPGAGRQGLMACILSYNGDVRVGFKADRLVVPDPEGLVPAYHEEMEALLSLAR